MSAQEHVKLLTDIRLRVWEESKRWLEGIHAEKRDMSAEENAQWERYSERLDSLEAEIRATAVREQFEAESATIYEAMGRQFGSDKSIAQREAEADKELRAYAVKDGPKRHVVLENGKTEPGIEVNIRAVAKERQLAALGASPDEIRAIAWDTGSIASAVPTTMARTLYQHMTAPVALLNMPTYKFETGSGEQMKFPRQNAHSIATQVSGQGTTLAGTDPTYLSMTLDAFKAAELIKASSEVLQDTVFDVASHLGSQIGRAIGQQIGTWYAVGTGSGQPQGIMGALTGSGTAVTGGTNVTSMSYEALIDLVYSVNGSYRAMNTECAFLFRDLTVARIRKIRDGAGGTTGAFIWDISQTHSGMQGAEPGNLLGYPVFTDPNVASMASDSKVGAFGWWPAFYIRNVGNVIIERSDERYFDTDEVGFRGKFRTDSDLIDTTAINIIKNSVA